MTTATLAELRPGRRVIVDAASRDSFAGQAGTVASVDPDADVPVRVQIPGEAFPIRFHPHELRLDTDRAGR